jgi:hypothetical protein
MERTVGWAARDLAAGGRVDSADAGCEATVGGLGEAMVA